MLSEIKSNPLIKRSEKGNVWNKFRNMILFAIFILILINSWEIKAQDKLKQLIFTKVMIVENSSNVWLEIFNPNNESVVLSSLRMSGIKTPNILPSEIRKNNGIELKPNERLIICSDKKAFEGLYGININIIEIKLLNNINDGGYLAMNHMEGIENSNNLIRFGDSKKSQSLADKVNDNQVLEFCNDEMCYSREAKTNGVLSDWTKTIPTPGK
jgi:hypothetical protein